MTQHNFTPTHTLPTLPCVDTYPKQRRKRLFESLYTEPNPLPPLHIPLFFQLCPPLLLSFISHMTEGNQRRCGSAPCSIHGALRIFFFFFFFVIYVFETSPSLKILNAEFSTRLDVRRMSHVTHRPTFAFNTFLLKG